MRSSGENAPASREPGDPAGKRTRGWLIAAGAATLTWAAASVIFVVWAGEGVRTLLLAVPSCMTLLLEAAAVAVSLRRGPVRTVRRIAVIAFAASLIPLVLSLLALGLFTLSWAING